ncbi:RAMP superfamily CRISPR-associated protein [Dethiosulfovibrio salsuginis]|uniref:CRISPR-associated protein Csx10 n=1 Tax=Dethiosulfovibrio salsuginis TaxID=561720 RepID=A0A1X7KVB4_9BACT|nr:RAMP superfamily CRISPR-associated protein [Dethiosulfovibrio salsuginis]SMG45180.1 CRISPR-associated protein Csx10 [Dethiosulfovibrio salsuginis]
MKSILIEIQILSFWHAGSGIGRGSDLDAMVYRDVTGLPCLPGRTVKGILREGFQVCEDAGMLSSGKTAELFGSPATKERDSAPGSLRFNDAQLPEPDRSYLASSEGALLRQSLYSSFASTSLDENGLAKDYTLRTIELAVPVTLVTSVSSMTGSDVCLEDFIKACSVVRGIGGHRTRGLGRCRWTAKDGGELGV